MTPASTTTMRWFPFARAPTRSTSSTATMEKAKAEAETPNAAAPRRMAMAAPNAAPCEAPRMSGETSGFWNVPWNAAPAAARSAYHEAEQDAWQAHVEEERRLLVGPECVEREEARGQHAQRLVRGDGIAPEHERSHDGRDDEDDEPDDDEPGVTRRRARRRATRAAPGSPCPVRSAGRAPPGPAGRGGWPARPALAWRRGRWRVWPMPLRRRGVAGTPAAAPTAAEACVAGASTR